MLTTLHLPYGWTHARQRNGAAPVTPWILAAAVSLALSAVVAAGWKDWGVPEWAAAVAVAVPAAATIGTGLVAGFLKILNAIRELAVSIHQIRQQSAQAATAAVTKAINDSPAIPTTDEQRTALIRDLAKEVVPQLANEMLRQMNPPAAEVPATDPGVDPATPVADAAASA